MRSFIISSILFLGLCSGTWSADKITGNGDWVLFNGQYYSGLNVPSVVVGNATYSVSFWVTERVQSSASGTILSGSVPATYASCETVIENNASGGMAAVTYYLLNAAGVMTLSEYDSSRSVPTAKFIPYKVLHITNSTSGDRDGDGVPDDEDADPDDPDVQDEGDLDDDEDGIPNKDDPDKDGDGKDDWLEWRKQFDDNPFISSILEQLSEDRSDNLIEISLHSIATPLGMEVSEWGLWCLSFSGQQSPTVEAAGESYKPIDDATWVAWLGYINMAFKIVLFLGFVKLVLKDFSSL